MIAQTLAQGRLKELEEMKQERISLRERIDSLLLQVCIYGKRSQCADSTLIALLPHV